MPDLLVKLFELQNNWGFLQDQERLGIIIRKPIGPERSLLTRWVTKVFGDGWASEVATALGNRPVTCFIAISKERPVGFACYDATALGFFGPIGIAEGYRGQGMGRALLMACLLDMKLKGYGYAIIGWAEPADFYCKTVNAMEIPGKGSRKTGIYESMLRYPKKARSTDK